jgi:hypothetical protein
LAALLLLDEELPDPEEMELHPAIARVRVARTTMLLIARLLKVPPRVIRVP